MNSRILELLREIKDLIQGKGKLNRWMDIKHASDYTAVSRSTIRRAVQNGSLKASHRTGKLLFKVSDVESWLNG